MPKTGPKTFAVLLLAVGLSLMAAACGFNPMIIAAGLATTNAAKASTDIPISSPENDNTVLHEVIAVGRSLGYHLILKNPDSVTLRYTTSGLPEVVIGVLKTADVKVHQEKDNLHVTVAVSGEFGTGGQKSADRLLSQFQGKLLEKLESAHLTQPLRASTSSPALMTKNPAANN